MTEEHARKFAWSMAHHAGLRGEDVVDAEQVGAIKWSQVRARHDGYQYRAIRNAVVDMARVVKHRDRTEPLTWDHTDGYFAPMEDPYCALDIRLSLESALLEAKPECVDCLRLVMMGLDYAEGSAIMGISVAAFKARIRRLRKFLEPFGIF